VYEDLDRSLFGSVPYFAKISTTSFPPIPIWLGVHTDWISQKFFTRASVKIRGYENKNKNKNNCELDSCNYSPNAIIEMPH
jgi:hypothetical protein